MARADDDPTLIPIDVDLDPDDNPRYVTVGGHSIAIPGESLSKIADAITNGRGVSVGLCGYVPGWGCQSPACSLEWLWIPAGAPVLFTRSVPPGAALIGQPPGS